VVAGGVERKELKRSFEGGRYGVEVGGWVVECVVSVRSGSVSCGAWGSVSNGLAGEWLSYDGYKLMQRMTGRGVVCGGSGRRVELEPRGRLLGRSFRMVSHSIECSKSIVLYSTLELSTSLHVPFPSLNLEFRLLKFARLDACFSQCAALSSSVYLLLDDDTAIQALPPCHRYALYHGCLNQGRSTIFKQSIQTESFLQAPFYPSDPLQLPVPLPPPTKGTGVQPPPLRPPRLL
jgi:hypothetical protein